MWSCGPARHDPVLLAQAGPCPRSARCRTAAARSIQRIPSAATSGGSQSEWSKSGSAARKPSDATGTSIRNVLTGMPCGRRCSAAERGEALERGLRHPVGHLAGVGVERGRRRHVDDRARAPLDHAAARRPGSRSPARAGRPSKMRSKRFIGRSRSPGNVIAALLTRMSTGPELLDGGRDHRLDLGVDRRGSSAPRSPVRRRPRSGGRCRRCVPGSGSGDASVARAAQATSAPSDASATAVAAPTPRLAPVTMATLPLRSTARRLRERGERLLAG